MSVQVNRKRGPEYRQANTPNNAIRGKLWWDSTNSKLKGANGANWVN